MLHELEILEAKHIAELAAEARDARDRLLESVPEADLGEPQPARGEHNPAGSLGFDALPSDEPSRSALREAIEQLPPAVLRKIWALTLIGRGDYAAKDWDQAMAEAVPASDASLIDSLMTQADLHDYLMKGLYELKLA